MKLKKNNNLFIFALAFSLFSENAICAVALDRTRVIYDGDMKSISLNITNHNKQLPYLAQAWIENEEGEKISEPLAVLPPIQRIEPGKASQIRVQRLPQAATLPQDRESVFYFNLREIPPKSNKPNTLQIALQTRVKLFYRPANITPQRGALPWQESLKLAKINSGYRIENPTPYYVTIVKLSAIGDDKNKKGPDPFMVAPFEKKDIDLSNADSSNTPILTYINDFGGRPELKYSCKATVCTLLKD
ncbi:molecular chaperone [Salmonella enterica]|nr:molecular chaperone [Salmonella enterica]